ncbi:MAG: PQQ-dependent sugar dehydrogenase [Hyphomonadaceae bacterium]|nr:PQQ-dependent sugar dehydrogenase [Hyphomonadaceae bacterium]
MIRNIAASLALPAFTLITGCTGAADHPPASDTPITPTAFQPSLTLIADEVEFPWGMAALPGGDILLTEREGRLRVLRDGALLPEAVTGLPGDILIDRQGGLLDVELHPAFDDNRLVYLTYAKGTTDDNNTAVIRGRLSEDLAALENVEEIFASNVPGKQGGIHFGSRLAFMNDGSLIVTLGDGYRWMDEAQNTENHFGKILRMSETGEPLPDNPFFDQGGPARYVWSYGHRNVQGLAYDSARDILYAHEHGPKGGDELNIIEPGVNYGWPEITYGVNYDGTIISTETEAEGMAQPETWWVPSIAPSGMVLYTGETYPGWQGDLIIGAMQGPDGRKLVRIDLDENGQVLGREDLLKEMQEGFREVAVGADGSIYLGTIDIDGKIYRLDVGE